MASTSPFSPPRIARRRANWPGSAASLVRGPRHRRQAVGDAPRRPCLRARRRIRPHSQPGRFCAPRLLAAGGDAGGDDDPRLFLAKHPARLQGVRGSRPLCRDQRRRPQSGSDAASIHHGIRLEDFPFDPHGSEICSTSAAFTPIRGRPRRLRRHVERVGGWSSPALYRIRTIIGSMSRPRSTTVPWSITARWAGRRRKNPEFRGSAAPPHQLRRAVRAFGRGGTRQRYAGHRRQPWSDARADRPWRDGLLGQQRR